MALTESFCTECRGVICDGKWSENFTAERTSRLMFTAESITRMKNYMNEDHRSCIHNFCRQRKESLKRISGLYGIRTLDSCDTGAALYQLSWQASWDDLHSYNSSLCSSFFFNHIFITLSFFFLKRNWICRSLGKLCSIERIQVSCCLNFQAADNPSSWHDI